MSWRTVVISERAKLEHKLGYLVVKKSNESVKILLDEVSILIVENIASSLTASLLSELMKKKIKVVFCDIKRNPQAELIPYYGTHNSSMKIKEQLAWNHAIKSHVWTRIVREKIRNQSLLLRHRLLDEHLILDEYVNQVEEYDITNREGHAAKVYFNALFGMEFNRHDDTLENAALNYGYSILLSAFNREIVSNGYLTQLGLYHSNMFNHFNFSSDLMEPFRPLVDELVSRMSLLEFKKDQKMQLVNLMNKPVFINGREQYLLNAISVFCRSVFEALSSNDESKIRFFRFEL